MRAAEEVPDASQWSDEPQEGFEDLNEGDILSPEQLRKLHIKMDADANRKLSLDEVLDFIFDTRKSAAVKESKRALTELDGDKDGKVSMEELWKDSTSVDGGAGLDGQETGSHDAYRDLEEKKFKMADGNQDGLLDETELAAFLHPDVYDHVLQVLAQHTMEEKDHDKDGFLTFDEFWKPATDPSDSENPEVLPAEDADLQMFKKLDKDGSDQLDLKEMLAWESGHIHTVEAMKKFVQMADQDKDQHLDLRELQEAHGGNEEDDEAKYYFLEVGQHHEL